MKKINFFLTLIAVVMLVGLTNCKKDLKDTTPDGKQYVKAVAASFNVVPAIEITTKALTPTIPLVWQTMYMYTSNANFYSPFLAPTIPNASYALVRGLEFLGGSEGQVFWSNTANNPASFAANLQVISNLTPDENVRVVVEGTDANNNIAYIGANDFNPNAANFPLNITQYRLGDVLTINADAITSLPGVTSVVVSFQTKVTDLPATRIGSFLGTNLGFGDIKLGDNITPHNLLIPANYGRTFLSNTFVDKVVGNIVITITAGANVITLPYITATAYGHGMDIVLTTTKVGSFDSAIMQLTPADIDVTTTTVPVN